jgi:hypothetical protein
MPNVVGRLGKPRLGPSTPAAASGDWPTRTEGGRLGAGASASASATMPFCGSALPASGLIRGGMPPAALAVERLGFTAPWVSGRTCGGIFLLALLG